MSEVLERGPPFAAEMAELLSMLDRHLLGGIIQHAELDPAHGVMPFVHVWRAVRLVDGGYRFGVIRHYGETNFAELSIGFGNRVWTQWQLRTNGVSVLRLFDANSPVPTHTVPQSPTES